MKSGHFNLLPTAGKNVGLKAGKNVGAKKSILEWVKWS
jgi:hypothetical protein